MVVSQSFGGGLSKEQRIRRRAEYQAIQTQGRRLQTPHFLFVVAARPSEVSANVGPRLGVVVSRKVGNSVVRSRVKRLIREAFRACRGLFGSTADVVVIARSRRDPWGTPDVIAEWKAASDRIMKLVERLGLARPA